MSEYIFKLPDLGEGTVEAEIGEWAIAVGDTVAEEQVIGTMMTDKAAVEISTPVAGTVVRIAGEAGDMIAVGAPLVVFATDGAAPAEPESDAAEAPAPQSAPTPAPTPAPAAAPLPRPRADGKVVTSPAIRRRARQMGIDLTQVGGSGPNGRILPRDFDAFVERGASTVPAPRHVPTETTEIKVIGLRRMIANRMSEAKREIPHFAYVEEIDVTELEKLRAHVNERDAQRRLTPLPFIATAMIRALRDFPQCNASYDKERNVIVRHGEVHLGIATQTPDGLKVPVVRHAERLDVYALATEIKRVTGAARDNTIGRNELTGSTITLTSLGKMGGIASTPVINAPEVAIVGVNRAVQRPMVVDGQIAVRTMMNLSSSFDHRFVDGFDAASMIQRIREMLEHPGTLFMP
ncbi:MAG: dihydrolipoamide acetyltransferase family protein [Pseudomonadota bacterium]